MLYHEYKVSDESEPDLAIWSMDESVDEMLTLFEADDRALYSSQISQYSYDRRKLEFLTSRHLINLVTDERHRIGYEPSGRPFLIDSSLQINISHTRGYVAIAIHRSRRVALDIEYRSEKVERVMHKFLSAEEQAVLSSDRDARLLQLHVLWCAKETMYKVMHTDGVDFADHLHVMPFNIPLHPCLNSGKGSIDCYETRTAEARHYKLMYRVYPEFVMVYTAE